MPPKHRPLDRESGIERDASLVVIASEDRYAASQYFGRFRTRKVKIIVDHTADNNSSPSHVLERLRNKVRELETAEGDSFWICIDRDRWKTHTIGKVIHECRKRNFKPAISHPCFEFWVLLHFQEPADINHTSCENVCRLLREHLGGGYGKECCRTASITKEMVAAAMERARSIDPNDDNVPSVNMTHVYKILEEIVNKDGIINFS